MTPFLHLAASLAVYPFLTAECDRLARDLASPEYARRERATRRLARMPLALPELRRASLSPIPEQAVRANRILSALEADPASPVHRRLEEWVRLGRADLVADYARRGRTDGWSGAEAVHRVGSQCYRLAQWDHPEVDLFRFRLKSANLDAVPHRDRAVLLGDTGQPPPDSPRAVHGCYRGGPLATEFRLLTAAVDGTLDAAFGPACGTLIATDRATLSGLGGTYAAVVVTDGDLRLKVTPAAPDSHLLNVSGAVIACGGDTLTVGAFVSLTDSVVFARGNVVLDPRARLERTTILAGGTIRWDNKTPGPTPDCVLREKVADPFVTLPFFTLAEVGLHARPGTPVVVAKVDARSPVAWAGVKAGDTILAVDDKPVREAGELRRLVRTGYALGGFILAVRRGAETKELVVRFPE